MEVELKRSTVMATSNVLCGVYEPGKALSIPLREVIVNLYHQVTYRGILCRKSQTKVKLLNQNGANLANSNNFATRTL